MTGRYPSRFGIRETVIPPWRDYGLPVEEETMADVLGRNGYTNRAAIGKWHMGHSRLRYYPLNRGFTHFHGALNGAFDYFDHTREKELDTTIGSHATKKATPQTLLLLRLRDASGNMPRASLISSMPASMHLMPLIRHPKRKSVSSFPKRSSMSFRRKTRRDGLIGQWSLEWIQAWELSSKPFVRAASGTTPSSSL